MKTETKTKMISAPTAKGLGGAVRNRAATLLRQSGRAARTALLMFVMVFTTLTAQATDFITDVMVIGHDDQSSINNLKRDYENLGWTVIDNDLNAGCGTGSDYIYLLYKTNNSPGSSGTPITGFYIYTGEDFPVSVTYGGHTYSSLSYTGSESFINSFGDLNHNAGGDYIYLYYTKDVFPGHPSVTNIEFNADQNGALVANGDGEEGYDLNAGCGAGTNYIYMHVTISTEPNVVMLTSESTDIELHDGDVLAGRADNAPHVTIADGATVTLSGAEIYVYITSTNQWPGITCLGDATIILDEDFTNTVKGGYLSAGIYVPQGKTLTIQGNGTLDAYSVSFGAGIGSNYDSNSGTIVIEGGTINATGDEGAAGIGCGKNGECETIAIRGGNITAVGGYGAAGIGSGNCMNETDHSSSCESIVISGGTVRATGGSYGAGIGSGQTQSQIDLYESICNSITISGGDIKATGKVQGAGIGTGGGSVIPFTMYGARCSHCGNITISGGTINANGDGGAGIGSAFLGICENITITNGVTRVTATTNPVISIYADAIGRATDSEGYNSSCHIITIGGVVTGRISQSPFTTYPYTVSFNANGGTGTMADMSFMYGVAQNLTANSFTHPQGFSFIGWATDPNGPTVYNDEESVSNLTETLGGTATLYAKWDMVTLTQESEDVLLSNGNFLTGTGGTHTHVTIADGATVTLSDVNITAIDVEDSECQWAGITCLGDAVIILAEGTTNNVKGGRYSSGIFVPEGKTLTIQGSGILNASSDDGDYGCSAGIGGSKGSNSPTFNSYQTAAGNIVIAGGTVNANGGWMAAGIGSGYTNSSCGNITITGGTVTANNGGNTATAAGIGSGYLNSSCGNITISGGNVVSYGKYESPGIGSGPYNSSCGNIVITNGVTMVTVTKGEECDITIGAGAEGSTCGTVTIGSTLTSEISGYTQWIYHQLILADNADNTSAISETNGITCLKATLTDRTLYKDGDWNTLCLPFGVTDGDATDYVTFSGTPLEGATVMELDTDGDYSGNQTGFDAATGTLYLYFKTATAIEAGKPYLVKWTKPDGYDLAPYEHNIFSPVFSSAAVTTAAPEDVTFADGLYTVSATNSGLRTVQFIGTYNPVALTPNDQSNLFLGDANTLYYPNAANNADGKYYVNACRAYFHVDLTGAANAVRAFVLGFGDDEQTGIASLPADSKDGGAWYTLDGLRLSGKPSASGVYINNGHKVVIK